MISVYSFPNTRGLRITWVLEEMEVPYKFVSVDLASASHKQPEFLAINPGGKVPAIRDGDVLMTESGAIVTFLADKYSQGKLIPEPGTDLRARYEQWSYFALCELEQGLWSMGKHKFALPKEQRVPELLPTAAWEFQQALALFSEGLGDRSYILGESFSGADILLVQTLHWALAFKQPIEQENVMAYYQRAVGRPAFIRACERETQA